MDWNHKFKDYERKLDAMRKEYETISQSFEDCAEFTDKFLNLCKEHGLSKIAIGVSHESVKSSVGFPWPSSSVFSNEHKEDGTWPTIWQVVKEAGIYSGCGNHMQAQANTSRLVDGVYHLKDGKWFKVGGGVQ